MTSIAASRPALASRRSARPLFTALVFAGSFLLFLVEPMVARLALPRLGGAPAVWNSAMLVYQSLLLAGYLFAHLLGRLPPRWQAAAQLVALLIAALWLPIALGAPVAPGGDPVLWVPLLLLASVGPPFFAVAALAPLMQRWFAIAEPGVDPYPLYAASNLGSFAGLFAYPFLLEPLLSTHLQSRLWAGGYAALLLLVAGAALSLPRAAATREPAPAIPARAAPALARRLRWVALAAVPSGLMLATTTHLTTDIVAMPLLWVLPLGLYLLSFTIAFGGRFAAPFARAAAPLLLASATLVFALGASLAMAGALIGLATLFVVSVALHARMYGDRPDPRYLTGFYLASSLGGVIGGLFCAIVAPLLFDWVWEYPLLLIAAAALLADGGDSASRRLRLWALPVALLCSMLAAGMLGGLPRALTFGAGLLGIAIAARLRGDRGLFAPLLALVMLGFGGWGAIALSATTNVRARSYFGVYTVIDQPGQRLLLHGTTVHGIQRTALGHMRDPTSYYAPRSGSGLAFAAAPALFGRQARIGVIGLGIGTLACYAEPGERWRFFEIDPAVAGFARDRSRFTFLSDCTPRAPIVIGDGRLMLGRERDASFDVLALDAFSSDSVPVHMLTREAFDIYRAKLAPNGLLVINITNRWIDLAPVIAREARAGGWSAAMRIYAPDAAASRAGALRSVWVALSASPATVAALETRDRGAWAGLPPDRGQSWSDDFASILPLLRIGGAGR